MSAKETQLDEFKFDNKKSKKDFRDKYFIKDIENLTGIKAYTLRIWEQRYNMLVPKRTDTNIRYYEEDDLKYLMNVSILNANGYKISRIAKMNRDEVQRLAKEAGEVSSKYQSQIQALTNAMMAFDETEFNKILSISILKLGMEETVTDIIFPFMKNVGMLWLSGSIHVAHEHFITNLIKQRLYVAMDQLGGIPRLQSKKFLLFVPNGENHDLSLLFASYMLKARGQKVIYLGTSTPLDDLNKIFKLHHPDAVFCAVTASNQQVPIEIYMQSLQRTFPDTPVLITGSQVVRRKDLKAPQNVMIISRHEDLTSFLDRFIG
jgi:DNA-binding transcriptional MerR regulator